MIVTVIVLLAVGFALGWAFSAEHHRKKQWLDEHRVGGRREWYGPFVKPD